MIKKRFIFGVFFLAAVFLIMNLNFTNAIVIINNPISFGSYSTIMNVSITSDAVNSTTISYNVTLYCNKSGGSVSSRTGTDIYNIVTIFNSSAKVSNFENSLVSTSGFTESALYNCSVYADNGTMTGNAPAWSPAVSGITIDKTAPVVSGFFNVVAGGNYSGVVTLNVSVTDGTAVDSVYFNITNSSAMQVLVGGVIPGFIMATNVSGNYYSITVSTSGVLPDGLYNITVYANDTAGNLNSSQRIQVLLDNTAPTATFSCSPSSVIIGGTVTCTCTPSDANGINSSLTSYTSNPDTQAAGNNSLTCTFYDFVGNLGTATTTYKVNSTPINSSTPQTPSTNPGQLNLTTVFSQITPINISVMNNFDPSFGINEIRINVSTEADNVQITVMKYDTKPDAVSVNKTGRVLTYLQIQAQNLTSHLNNAIVKIQVNKTWISVNSLTKDDIFLFRYNEGSNHWDQLTTTFVSEDTAYDYYEIELQSFSFFAIGGEVLTTPPSTTPPSTLGANGATETPTKDFTWVWVVLVGIVVVIILVLAFLLIKRKTY